MRAWIQAVLKAGWYVWRTDHRDNPLISSDNATGGFRKVR